MEVKQHGSYKAKLEDNPENYPEVISIREFEYNANVKTGSLVTAVEYKTSCHSILPFENIV